MLPPPRWSALAALLLGAACRHRYSWPTPPPLTLERPAPPLAITRCEPAGEPDLPTGRTPPPVADGALRFVEQRGDDRVAIAEDFIATWSPDGAHLYTATRGAVRVWAVPSGVLEATWPLGAPVERLHAVAASADGAFIGVVGYNRPPRASVDVAVTWLLRTGERPSATPYAGVGGVLHVTADGRAMFTEGHAWDLATGAHRETARPPGLARWLPDGRRAVVLTSTPGPHGSTYTPAMWDAGSGRVLHTLPTTQLPDAVALSGDGERVAVLHGRLDVFSTRSFERVARVDEVPSVGLVSLSHDGHLAVVESLRCVVLASASSAVDRCPAAALDLWDLDHATRLARTAQGAGEGWHFAPDGRHLTGPDTRLVTELLRVPELTPVAFGDRVRSLSPDGRYLLSEHGPALRFEALDGATLAAFAPAPRVVARSPDGRRVATLDGDGLRVEGDGSCVRVALAGTSYGAHPAGTEAFDVTRDRAEFSADGATLYALNYVDGGTPRFRALDSASGRERWSMAAARASTAAMFVTSGSVLVQGRGRPEVLRFDANTGAALGVGRAPRLAYTTPWTGGATYEVRDPDGDRVSDLTVAAATRDGRAVGTMGFFDNAVWFSRWDLAQPERVRDSRVGELVDRVALSPDERWWAVGLRDGAPRVFPVAGAGEVTIDAGHRGRVTALAWAPSGDRLYSASDDGVLSLSELPGGRVVGRARFAFDAAVGLWVSPDGTELRAETRRGLRVRFAVAGR
jgi:WD40 repeat protein